MADWQQDAISNAEALRLVLWHWGQPGGLPPQGDAQERATVLGLLTALYNADADTFSRLESAFPSLGFWAAQLRFEGDAGQALAYEVLAKQGVTL